MSGNSSPTQYHRDSRHAHILELVPVAQNNLKCSVCKKSPEGGSIYACAPCGFFLHPKCPSSSNTRNFLKKFAPAVGALAVPAAIAGYTALGADFPSGSESFYPTAPPPFQGMPFNPACPSPFPAFDPNFATQQPLPDSLLVQPEDFTTLSNIANSAFSFPFC